MQIACAWASASIACSIDMFHSWSSIFLVMAWPKVGPVASSRARAWASASTASRAATRQLHLDQRPDDLVHVAARAEIAAGAGHHHGADLAHIGELAEQVAELGVAREGQRVLALRPVERDRRDRSVDRPAEMRGREALGAEGGEHDRFLSLIGSSGGATLTLASP